MARGARASSSPPATLPRDGSLPARALRWMRSRGAWLELCYALVALPFVGWVGGVPRVLRLGRRARAADASRCGAGRPTARTSCSAATSATSPSRGRSTSPSAPARCYAAPWLARGVAAVQVAMARLLLEPGERERLTARVDTLEETRAGMVAAADAERRRIERDLHDGAQQRLVALAMTLGRAKATEDPALAARAGRRGARRGQGGARRAAQPRARHPPRGADRPRPGRRRLRARRALPGAGGGRRRPAAPRRRRATEAIAYFVVAEALTNVAKHAQATRAWLTAEYQRRPARGRGARQRRRRRRLRPASASAACATACAPSTATCIVVEPARRRDDPASGAAMRAVIAEDAVLLREGLARLLERGRLRGRRLPSPTARRCCAPSSSHQPDVCVVDVRMPPTFSDEGVQAPRW